MSTGVGLFYAQNLCWLVGCVLRHIYPCRLFNANPVNTYLLNICKKVVSNIFKGDKAHLFTHRWFQTLLFNLGNSSSFVHS